MRPILAALILALISPHAPAQTPQVSLAGTEVHPLATAANGVDYELYVHVAPQCSAQTPCPTVYMLDAEYSFGLAALIADHLGQRGELQPLVLIAVSYKDKSQYRLNRTRDYTPVFVAEGGYGPQFQAHSGGAPAFLAALADEIIPYVEMHFPVSPNHRGLVGHSFGGLFASYALLERSEVFDHYLIVSPSLWYGDAFIPQLEPARLNALPAATEVFFSIGSLEEPPHTSHMMIGDMLAFAQRLEVREDDNLEIATEVVPGQTHSSIFPIALSNGLRALFPPEN